MSSPDTALVYVTASSRDEAVRIGRTMVEERLAACANILGEITSFYWWDGAVQDGQEVALILKTRALLVERLTARIKEMHGYSCPCVVAVPLDGGGNADFFQWIVGETQG